MKLSDFIIYMKIGPFCGYSLEEIIDIKKEEEKSTGRYFLGYGGVFCHPPKVLRFLQVAKENGVTNPQMLFSTTDSNFTSPIEKSKFYTADGYNWEPLGDEILLVGSKFAFVAKDLRKVSIKLDLSQYKSMLGRRRGKRLSEYIKYRVDKSCAIYSPDKDVESKIIDIEYMSTLVYPYCVAVK